MHRNDSNYYVYIGIEEVSLKNDIQALSADSKKMLFAEACFQSYSQNNLTVADDMHQPERKRSIGHVAEAASSENLETVSHVSKRLKTSNNHVVETATSSTKHYAGMREIIEDCAVSCIENANVSEQMSHIIILTHERIRNYMHAIDELSPSSVILLDPDLYSIRLLETFSASHLKSRLKVIRDGLTTFTYFMNICIGILCSV